MYHLNSLSGMLLTAAQSNFVWREHMGKLITTGLLSMVPAFEGRYAVVTSIGMGVPVVFSYFLALLCSTIPMPLIFLLLRPILDWFYTLPIAPVQKFAAWLERRSTRKHAKMEEENRSGWRGRLAKYFSEDTIELIGLYVFVALPLPGTGVWTGSAIATLFDMPRGKSALAIFLGNATACLITTLMTTGVLSLL